MRTALLAGALLLGLAAPAAAAPADPQMSAGEFLKRAEPLLKKSKASLIFSGEARRLIKLVGKTAEENRARLDADRSAGRAVATCLPPKGKASISTTELLSHIRALSPQQREQSFDSAFASLMAKKYPCRS